VSGRLGTAVREVERVPGRSQGRDERKAGHREGCSVGGESDRLFPRWIVKEIQIRGPVKVRLWSNLISCVSVAVTLLYNGSASAHHSPFLPGR